MLGFLLMVLFIGIVAGYLARLLVAGPDPMSFWQTVLLGIVGSLIGGTVGSLLISGRLTVGLGGIVLAIPGAVVALLIYRKRKYGTIMPPRV
ncbi:MAG: GlsB/YeaQ/YmgE family stress response membrane protein [Actinomycetota bacterium]